MFCSRSPSGNRGEDVQDLLARSRWEVPVSRDVEDHLHIEPAVAELSNRDEVIVRSYIVGLDGTIPTPRLAGDPIGRTGPTFTSAITQRVAC